MAPAVYAHKKISNSGGTVGHFSQGRMENDSKKDVTAIGKPRIVKVDLYEEPHEATGEGFCKAPRLSFVECSCPDASALGRQKKSGEAAGIDKCWWVVVLAFLMTTMESATSRCSGFLYVGIIEQMNVDRGLASWPVNLVTSVNDFGGLVSGPLSEHFSTVPVMAVGSVLASAGVIASAYAPDVTWISVSLGIVHGFFRDNLGSYNAMFWLLGSLCIFIGLLWMMVSWFERKKVRNWELDIARNMPCTLHM